MLHRARRQSIVNLIFFLGNWLVRDRSDHIIGTATVSREYSGCVLIEKWRDAGDSGEGLGVAGYVPASITWHEDFIDHSGFVLTFDGHMRSGAMAMTGKDYSKQDVTQLHRLTWTPKSDGSVEELWQTSTDDGRSWRVHFDGVFRRIAE